MKFSTKLIVFIQILILMSIAEVKSQNKIDNAGTEFYFAYMPNWHNTDIQFDTIYVFVSAKEPTSGNIEYTRRNGTTGNRNFSITSPGEIITLTFSSQLYELMGHNESGTFRTDGGDDEKVVNTSFRLTSDDDVTVVIHNEAQYTSDACLVYPADALGQNYFVFSYESNISDDFFGTPSRSNTPSQFVIVASEDNTNVSISPTAETFRFGRNDQNIVLNKGQVYLVQAKVNDKTNSNGGNDLTGTRVKTDKPVAVFGGHQRANIPFDEVGSRDYLLSQMIPLEAWGKDVFIVPFFQPGNIENTDDFDITKITVAYDDTELSVSGSTYQTLNRGESITQEITSPIYVTGDKPIRACLYKKSAKNPGSDNSTAAASDPFMVLFPPKDQFLREYNFINVNLPFKYSEHYVNIIVPTVSIPNLRLDGNTINANFRPIEGIAYSYANVLVSAGSHNIVADTNFGICVYGYGQTNSYGYVGGLGLEVLDWIPPSYTLNEVDCFTKEVGFSELEADDSGIDSIVVVENINIDIEVTDSTKTTYSSKLNLIDKYNDGYLNFYAIDSAGTKTKDKIFIEGFTLTLTTDSAYSQVEIIDTVKINSYNCVAVTITNYGLVRKDISSLKLKNGVELSKIDTPQSLAPGESHTFDVCYQSTTDFGLHSDTLIIENNCFEETMGVVGFFLAPDDERPGVSSLIDDCGKGTLIAEESTVFDYGFGTYEKIADENLEIVLQKFSTFLIEIDMYLIDPYKDGIYEFKFTDQAGNDSIISGIIQGFTASFVKDNDEEVISFTSQDIGNSKCIDIMIENNGLLPITLNTLELSERVNFFIPQSQLPLTIQPDTAVPFKICFYDVVPNDLMLEDELKMTFNCLEKNIQLDGQTRDIVLGANSKCDYELRFTFGEVPSSLSLENIYPNPTDGELNMRLLVEKDRAMTIDLINTNGTQYEVMTGKVKAGGYDFRIDATELPSGTYVLQIKSENNRLTEKVLINK